jgi:type IV pilus assembly protein PilP
MNKLAILLLVGFFLGMSSGCGDETPKPTKVPIAPTGGAKPAAPAPAKEAPKPMAEAKVEPPPPGGIPFTFTYNPAGKPNPFQPLVVDKPEKPSTPPAKKVEAAGRDQKEEPGTPLEKVELAALKLVAVVWDISNPRAMVEDASGKGYILTRGTRVGKHQGQVTKITSAGIIVQEKVEGSDGKIKTREVPLRLYADQ